MQELIQKIQEKQSSLSATQRSIANYVTANYTSIPFQTIAQIAALAKVSETSVFLFCKDMGFSGFSDFKRYVTTYVNNTLPLNNRLASTAANVKEADAVQEVIRCDVENVQATLTNPTNLENLPLLLAKIDKAHHIYTIGGRSAGFFAAFLAFKLRQQDLNVSNIDFSVGDYIDKMMMIRPGDLVIIFSFPRYTKIVVKIAQILKGRGIPIVLITSEKLSPCSEFADLVFSCRTVSCSYVASYSSCLSLINTILIMRALRHKRHTEEYLEELEGNLRDFHIFMGD